MKPWSDVPPRFGLLARLRARIVWNHIRCAAMEAPIRLALTALFVVIIWMGLYALFYHVLGLLRNTPLEGVVAIPLVFNFFFLAMLALLIFSNAILAFGALFSRDEVAYLLALPLRPRDAVLIKYLETLVFSSWSL